MKKIIYYLCIFGFIFLNPFFASAVELDEVFIDIDDDYFLYEELEYVHEKWIIIPDEDNRFNASRVLNRWEFIRDAFKLGCESCSPYEISPRIVSEFHENNSFLYVIME